MKKRPYVVVNCAMSADGKIALPSGKQLRISCDEDMHRMYCMRNEHDAVLVGVGTVLSDNPRLTVKKECVDEIRNPVRVVLDAKCRTPEDALVVNQDAKTIIFTGCKCDKNYGSNVEVIESKVDNAGLIDLKIMLERLYEKGIRSLMVEGGSTVIWSFLYHGFVDEMFVYIGPIVIGGVKTSTLAGGKGVNSSDEVIHLEIVDVQRLGPGILIHYKTKMIK